MDLSSSNEVVSTSNSGCEDDDVSQYPHKTMQQKLNDKLFQANNSNRSGSDYQPSCDDESSDNMSVVDAAPVNMYKPRKLRSASSSSDSDLIIKNDGDNEGPRSPPTMNIDDEYGYDGGMKRQARRKARYKFESDSDEEEDGYAFYRAGRRNIKDDSDFEISDDADMEDVISFGSDSLVDEISSDEYIPDDHRRSKKRKLNCTDNYTSKQGKKYSYEFDSGDLSDSDYEPQGNSKRKRKRVKKAKLYHKDDYEDAELEAFGRTTGRTREFVSYKESSDIESDVTLRDSGLNLKEDDNSEKIEKILTSRIGRIEDTGKTFYAYTNNAFFPNHESGENVKQYLVKWLGWSHLHNTWETGTPSLWVVPCYHGDVLL
jgi:chromodomain-helicase-DNA-binding protein 1